jgi:hypothetical protein
MPTREQYRQVLHEELAKEEKSEERGTVSSSSQVEGGSNVQTPQSD